MKGLTSLSATTPMSLPMVVTYAWFIPTMENSECTFSREVFSTSWKGAGSMWHLSKFTPFVISSSSHCFCSSGDMSMTRSCGYTEVKKSRVYENTAVRRTFKSQMENWENCTLHADDLHTLYFSLPFN